MRQVDEHIFDALFEGMKHSVGHLAANTALVGTLFRPIEEVLVVLVHAQLVEAANRFEAAHNTANCGRI